MVGSSLGVPRPANLMQLSYDEQGYKTLASTGVQYLSRAVGEKNSNNTVFTRVFRSRIKLASRDGNYTATLSSTTPANNYSTTYHRQPQLVVHSPIHRALIVHQYISFYYANKNYITKTTRRVYFA